MSLYEERARAWEAQANDKKEHPAVRERARAEAKEWRKLAAKANRGKK